MNLAVNARDAMPTGGTLSVTTHDVVIDEAYARVHTNSRPGPHVLVRVIDTGTGMTPEVRARAFDPFFTTKGLGHGTGLGLSVVLGIIEQSGGWMDIESEEGKGTVISIYLAAHDTSVSDVDAGVDLQSARGTETILLVEDESVVRRVAARALVAAGYRVIEAVDGVDALAQYEAHSDEIDAVVTDVVMPRMGGRQFVSSLRNAVPVLFTSGYLDDAVVRHGVQQAEVTFLQKPYSTKALLAKVRQVLETRIAA
jgi:CheY-like chemotaxis protein